MDEWITVRGARLHNLRNITLSIPKNKLVVFTGLSGSGKSSLAFDTLHREGQRQYLESLGMVTHGVNKLQGLTIEGLSPSISVGQHLTNDSPRSTVGTSTEVFTYLRVLYARIGHRPCPRCGADVPPTFDVTPDDLWDDEPGEDGEYGDLPVYPCPACGAPVPQYSMTEFSFNTPEGACPTCTGLGTVRHANVERLLDPERSVAGGGVLRWSEHEVEWHSGTLSNAGRRYGFTFDLEMPIKELGPVQRDLLLYGVQSPRFRRHFPEVEPPTTVAGGRFEGIATNLLRRYEEHIHDRGYTAEMEKLLVTQVCPDCRGARLRPQVLKVVVAGRTIHEVAHLPLTDLARWLEALPPALSAAEVSIATPILEDLHERVRRLVDVGAGYLTLARTSPSLSAGEAQRLRMAALLGSGLTGVLYVLDEPTIGLHPRDTARLIRVLRRLRDLRNTVLVIEHDLDVIRAADFVVDMGPGAGDRGGEVVVAGPPQEVAACPTSVSGAYLAGRLAIPVPAARRTPNGKALVIRGAREHNLAGITVRLPLGVLIAVTGVSGSGKSSLMLDILDQAARQRFYGASDPPGEHEAIEGWEHLDRIVTIDQAAIGRTPRSNAATYSDAFTPIRQAFAATPEARERGLTASHFSFNVPGGRCDRCEGAGELTISMHFLPDVQVRCPACHGRRFKPEVLGVSYKGRTIADVLGMSIEDACALFQDVGPAASRLALMVDTGLGYLRLGQPATTLSGGEAQRVKLAKELGRRTNGRVLYLLDEPTTGLHIADVAQLLAVLQRLVDASNTVVVIEHNLDVIKTADWVIDLGPEGGAAGGRVVAEGTPEEVARVESSHTGAFLRQLLQAPAMP